MKWVKILTLSPPNKLSSALTLLNVGEKIVLVSNSMDPDETPSFSAFDLDPSCLRYGTFVVLGGLRVNNGIHVYDMQ